MQYISYISCVEDLTKKLEAENNASSSTDKSAPAPEIKTGAQDMSNLAIAQMVVAEKKDTDTSVSYEMASATKDGLETDQIEIN